jgi:DNA-binding CsgD family transcriptional regulator
VRRARAILSQREGRPVDQITPELVTAGPSAYRKERDLRFNWRRLNVQEQDIVALACLGYVGKAIAGRLHKSRNTVETQLTHARRKLGARGRRELRMRFEHWDLSSGAACACPAR